MELEGKVALVTGGAGNIGSACSRRLAGAGAAVVVSDLPGAEVKGIVDEVTEAGGRAVSHEGDTSDEQAVMEMISTCLREFGRIDVLVNVAAAIGLTAQDRDLTAMEVAYWDRIMEVNARGPMLTCKHALVPMLSQGAGSIVNFSSTAAFAGDDGLIAYSASKAAVLGLSRSIAASYGRQGIRCNAIAPSGVWNDDIRTKMGQAVVEMMEEGPLTPRLGVPDDVAHMVVYLASNKSAFITGQCLFVDGGSLAHQPWWPRPEFFR